MQEHVDDADTSRLFRTWSDRMLTPRCYDIVSFSDLRVRTFFRSQMAAAAAASGATRICTRAPRHCITNATTLDYYFAGKLEASLESEREGNSEMRARFRGM